MKNEYVSVPVKDARRILSNTAKSIGFDQQTADILAFSAWWLENRQLPCISLSIVYMLLVKDIPNEQRGPMKDQEFGTRCVCPFMAAVNLMDCVATRKIENTNVGFRMPANALLMAPLLTETARETKLALRLHCPTAIMAFTKEGFWLEQGDWFPLQGVDTDSDDPMGIELIDPQSLSDKEQWGTYSRNDELKLPKARLRGDDILHL